MKENQTLGRLVKIELREAWESEPQDFTPWLAEEENLRLLSESLGMDELELVKTEHGVGPFSADILCKNTLDDTFVLIENQLERTDHKHLGQLLTYAAGLEAVTIVWIAEKITEEHRAALDWLNQITPEKYSFFGLEIELWKIGTSVPAPKFNVVSKPNDWSKSTISAARGGELSDTRQTQLEYWTEFKKFLEARSNLGVRTPKPKNALSFSIGRTQMHISAIVSSWDSESGKYGTGEIRVHFVLTKEFAKSRFRTLMSHKEEIERGFDTELHWKDDPNAIKCTISVIKKCDFTQRSEWPEQHEWLLKYILRFQSVLAPYLRDMD